MLPFHQLVAALKGSRLTLIFTGAGISTASGIPDFRGPHGVERWQQPVSFQEFMASPEGRARYWTYKLSAWDAMQAARPNAAHQACAELDRLGRLLAVVTQNIDGLHQRSGLSAGKLFELHGTVAYIKCLECGRRYDPSPLVAEFQRTGKAPDCVDCGGPLKFATVSFGQNLDPQVLEGAFEAARNCDLVLAMGSSLSVQPAASVPQVARTAGARCIILNQGPTAQDQDCDLKIDGDVNDLFPKAVAALREG